MPDDFKAKTVSPGECPLCETRIEYRIVTECSCKNQSVPCDIGKKLGGFKTPKELYDAIGKEIGES